ncbi:MAG: choice-of-anchor D domain-containing protein [Luteolibacter sp.]
MKIPLISALVAIATISSASALTSDDIAPASLPGKTFTFTIKAASGTVARSGVWQGTFGAAPSNSFTISKVSGNTPGFVTTYSAFANPPPTPSGPFITSILLPGNFTGSGLTTLSLLIGGSTSNFAMISSNGTDLLNENGSFAIGSAPSAPEISVKQGTLILTDGSPAKISIGTAEAGKKVTKKFTITNTGNADLTGLSITTDGKNKGDFVVGTLAKKTLPGNTSVQFNVTFKPAAKGTKNAAFHIKSNDADEKLFDIKVTGVATK